MTCRTCSTEPPRPVSTESSPSAPTCPRPTTPSRWPTVMTTSGATVGLHPHDAKDWTDELESEFRQLASSDRVVAIGEIDWISSATSHRTTPNTEHSKSSSPSPTTWTCPSIHSRDAHEESFTILKLWADKQRRTRPIGVIHCFSGDANLAQRYHKLGFLISFAGRSPTQRTRPSEKLPKPCQSKPLSSRPTAPTSAPNPAEAKETNPPTSNTLPSKSPKPEASHSKSSPPKPPSTPTASSVSSED